MLGCTADFVKQNPNAARALTMAVLEASRYIDMMSNRPEVAKVIARVTTLSPTLPRQGGGG